MAPPRITPRIRKTSPSSRRAPEDELDLALAEAEDLQRLGAGDERWGRHAGELRFPDRAGGRGGSLADESGRNGLRLARAVETCWHASSIVTWIDDESEPAKPPTSRRGPRAFGRIDPVETHPLAEEDRAILDLEGPTIVGHTCKVIGLRSTPSLEALRDWIDARLGPARELRRRLDPDAGDPPAWVDDDRFDVAHHVVAAGSAASEDELCEGVADLFAAHLDRERPLWRLDLIGLPEQRAALVWRIHHALADGTAAMRLGSLVLGSPLLVRARRPRRPPPQDLGLGLGLGREATARAPRRHDRARVRREPSRLAVRR